MQCYNHIRKKVVVTGAFRFNMNEAAEVRVLYNAKILRELGYDVMFIPWGGKYSKAEFNDFGYFKDEFNYLISSDLPNSQTSIFKKVFLHLFNGLFSVKYINQVRPDIIIGYNPSVFFTLLMVIRSAIYKCVYISDLTEWYDSRELPGGKYSYFSVMNYINMKIVQKLVNNKILISKYLDSYYNKSVNIIIPPLFDSSDKKWSALIQCQDTVLVPRFEGLTLIYAGYFGMKDLLFTVLESVMLAVDDMLPVRILILGSTKEQIISLIGLEKYNIYKHNIIVLGIQPQNLVPQFYKYSDFSIILREPIRKNLAGFPTKFVESLSSECPVIANITSDLKDFIVDGYNGIILSEISSKALYSKLKLLCSSNIYDKSVMKTNSRLTAIDCFSYLNYVSKMRYFLAKID